jgi:hypothetical protein
MIGSNIIVVPKLKSGDFDIYDQKKVKEKNYNLTFYLPEGDYWY